MTEYVLNLAPDSSIEHYAIDTEADQIVRCRDCKHAVERRPLSPITGVPCGFTEYRCDYFWNPDELPEVEPDGFCAWAVRRDG